MRCDICDHSTDGITSLTHHRKIYYTPEKTFDCTKWGKGFGNRCSFTSTLSDPQQKQSESVSMLYLWKMFSGKIKS